jgi:hypothetical protein
MRAGIDRRRGDVASGRVSISVIVSRRPFEKIVFSLVVSLIFSVIRLK